jgi:hypothetical protein
VTLIVDTPLGGDKITIEGVPTEQFQAFLESLERAVNGWQPRSFTVADVISAADNERMIIYVSDESGGATLAFSDGTNWRRVQDRAIIT